MNCYYTLYNKLLITKKKITYDYYKLLHVTEKHKRFQNNDVILHDIYLLE